MKISITTLCLLFFACNNIYSQKSSDNNSIYQSIKIQSEILSEETEIQVYLPDSYSDNTSKYPVLYVMDGQRYFLNGIAFQQNLSWQEIAPQFIIIGIFTDNRTRDNWFYDESPKFINFLEKELIPKIDNDYRTIDERIYFGWEIAAGLGIEILAKNPSLFKGYLLSSPTYITNNRLNNLSSLFEKGFSQNLRAYATLGTVENWAIGSMEVLDSIFQENKSENIKWKYNLSSNENHYTTPLTTITEGLKYIFNDYGPIRFYSLKEFNEYGGIEALLKHYKKRADRYQLPEEIHEDTKHYLLLQSSKENDFKLFERLVKEFDGQKFIAKYYNWPRWFVRYANFYAENDKHENAIEILNLGMGKFPDNSKLQNEMGNCFKQAGKISKAKKWYKEAIATAKKNGESEVKEYVKNLESL